MNAAESAMPVYGLSLLLLLLLQSWLALRPLEA